MKLKGKNVSIHDTLKEHNLKGDCIMGDFLNADFNILKISSEEVHKNVPKLYAYDVRGKNNETEAIIAFKIISMLNEYKLASLHFISDNEASLIEGLEILLEHQILKNSMLKITAYPKSEKEVFILEHLGFVKNKQDGNIIEYKITKPIYMKGR